MKEMNKTVHINESELSNRIAIFILKYKWLIIFLNIAVIVGLSAAMLHRIREFEGHRTYIRHIQSNPLDKNSNHISPPPIFNADYHVFFDGKNQDLEAYDEFQNIFSRNENIIIAITAKDGDIFTNQNLNSIKEITDEGWSIPYVNRVDSLTNYNYTYVETDDLVVEDFINKLPIANEELIVKKKLALADPVMANFLVSRGSDIAQISLSTIIPSDFPEGFMDARVNAEKLVESVLSKNKNLEAKLSGTVILNSSFQEFAAKDMKNLNMVMFLIIFIVLFLIFRSFYAVILPLILLITSILLPMFIFVGLFKFYITNVTMSVIQILAAVSIADSVHVLWIFYREVRRGATREEAVRLTVNKNLLACFLTSLTTAIGFYSLLLQDVPPYQVLGLFAGTGTVYAFLVSLFTMPSLLAVLPVAKTKQKYFNKSWTSSFFGNLLLFVNEHQRKIRWASVLIMMVSSFYIFKVVIDNNPLKYFAKETVFRKATEYIDSNVIGTNPIEFNFDSGEPNGIYSPDFLGKIEKFSEYIGSHPEFKITYVSSILDVVKKLNKSMNLNDDKYNKIPTGEEVNATSGERIDAKKLIGQYLLLYNLSLPHGLELNNQMSVDHSKARVTAYMRSVSTVEQLKVAKELNGWLEKNMPETKARALGVPMMFANMTSFAIPGMMKGLVVSLIMISLVFIIVFRSVKYGLIGMFPNIWPIIIVFGVVGITGYMVNLSVSVVGMITLGIIVDDTTHFLVKYLNARKHNKEPLEAISWTFDQVGAPLVFTSIILIAGFGILMLSEFSLNWDMGAFCSSVIALGLLADLIILPAFILKFDSLKSQVS